MNILDERTSQLGLVYSTRTFCKMHTKTPMRLHAWYLAIPKATLAARLLQKKKKKTETEHLGNFCGWELEKKGILEHGKSKS